MFYDINLHHTREQAIQHRSESKAGRAFAHHLLLLLHPPPLLPLLLLDGRSTANPVVVLVHAATAALMPPRWWWNNAPIIWHQLLHGLCVCLCSMLASKLLVSHLALSFFFSSLCGSFWLNKFLRDSFRAWAAPKKTAERMRWRCLFVVVWCWGIEWAEGSEILKFQRCKCRDDEAKRHVALRISSEL